MKQPKRWLTVEQVAQMAESFRPKLKVQPKRARQQYARRLVRRVERLHAERYTKVVAGKLMVSADAIEYLLPSDVTTLTSLEAAVADLVQKNKGLQRQINGHGSRLHNLEEWRRLTQQYLEAVGRLNGVKPES